MSSYFVGMHVGASNVTVGAFDADGHCASLAKAPFRVSYPGPCRVEHDPTEWWAGVLACWAELTQAGVAPGDVVSVGLSCRSSLVFLDTHGVPVRPAIASADRRAVAQAVALADAYDESSAESMFGLPLSFEAERPAAQLRWVMTREPEVAERVHWVCQAKDFLGLQLCGEVSSDLASFVGVAHAFSGQTDPAYLADLGIRASQLPRWTLSTRNAGYSTREAQASLGLRIGIPIVTGAVDPICRMIGTGALRRGSVVMCGGAPAILGVVTPSVPRALKGFQALPFDPSGLFAYREVPVDDGGVGLASTVGELSEIAGEPVREIVVDRGSHDSGWGPTLADTTQLPVAVASEPETSALGAAILGAVGYGAFETAADASERMVRMGQRREPRRQERGSR